MTSDTEEKPKEENSSKMAPEVNGKPKELKENKSWWQQRTSMERGGIVFVIIAILVIIALIIALGIIASKESSKTNSDVCESSSCVEAAANIMKNVDKSVDPCDNFYEFACGNYLHETIIPEGEPYTNAFTDLEHLVENQLKIVFEEPPLFNETEAFINLKNLYSLCINTTAIESDGLSSLSQLFKYVGGWPTLDGNNWNQNNFDWRESTYKYRRYGLNTDYFLKISVEPDMKNSSQLVIYLDQADLGIDRDYLLKGPSQQHVQTEQEYMVNLALVFGAQKPIAEYDVKNVLQFRTELAKITLSDEDRQNETTLYNPMTINELQQNYPNIYWLVFLNKALAIPNHSLNATQKVIVKVPQYINAVDDLLRRTSKRTQANYAIYQVLIAMEPYQPESVRNFLQRYSTRDPRWRECVKITSKSLPLAASALYVRKYVKKENIANAMQIAANIKAEFINLLKETTWMDETTKTKAVEKAESMQIYAGYPEELLDDEKLENYYSDLRVSTTTPNLIQAVVNVSIFNRNKDVKILTMHTDKMNWTRRLPPVETKVLYSVTANSLTLPASFLQSNFFNENRLQSMNYGAIGYFIGKEIIHGFDEQGQKFDKDGNLGSWWTNDTTNNFKEKAKCFVGQYAGYTEPKTGLNVNGVNTLTENIADNAGIKEAYSAYTTWAESNDLETRLSGLKYTPKQLFWISTANIYCTKYKDDILDLLTKTDTHAPSQFRVNGPFSNSKYFTDDFSCPLGSKMNPEYKCEVW